MRKTRLTVSFEFDLKNTVQDTTSVELHNHVLECINLNKCMHLIVEEGWPIIIQSKCIKSFTRSEIKE